MKIAIKGHPTRGKEIISLLESFGNTKTNLSGNGELYTYYIDDNNVIRYANAPKDYKVYTLEEFETQFPFKVGDKVTFKKIDTRPYTIKSFSVWSDGDIVCEFEETMLHYPLHELKYYKEMKEERNITLTLEKAKEWYKKGGELKEIALQAFSEKELNPLPRSWAEFCINHPVKFGETYIGTCSKFISRSVETRDSVYDRYVCPSKKSAEAHLAMIQLEQLRDCWRQGLKLTPGKSYYVIKLGFRGLDVYRFCTVEFLSFPTREMAEEFLVCFRDLIEKAKDLI